MGLGLRTEAGVGPQLNLPYSWHWLIMDTKGPCFYSWPELSQGLQLSIQEAEDRPGWLVCTLHLPVSWPWSDSRAHPWSQCSVALWLGLGSDNSSSGAGETGAHKGTLACLFSPCSGRGAASGWSQPSWAALFPVESGKKGQNWITCLPAL